MNAHTLSKLAFSLVFAVTAPLVLAQAPQAHDPADVNARPGEAIMSAAAEIDPTVAAALNAAIGALPPSPTGDAKTACEVILCLAGSVGAGGGVAECIPPIHRFLTSFRPPRLFAKRLEFLRRCPMGSGGSNDPTMQALLPILVNAPHDNDGVCNASTLNTVNAMSVGDGEMIIQDTMPGECSSYFNHPYTDLQARIPVYVGEPSEGGFWASQEGFPAALASYQQQLEDRRRNAGFGNLVR